MKGQAYVILSIIFIIIVSIFAVTNVDTVEVNYLFWSGKSPLILVILFSVLMGGIITAAVGSKKIFTLKRDFKKQSEENTSMKETLKKHNLIERPKKVETKKA